MSKRILIIDGHPDPDPGRFCHALAGAYREGAEGAGHRVEIVAVGELEFPPLRSRHDWEKEPVPPTLAEAQAAIGSADHVVIIYPLWLGAMPGLLKSFLEQVLRPGFAISFEHSSLNPGLLKGKSARVVVTMGMPAFVYRWYFGAHSLKSLERNILKFCGFGPVRETVIGMVESGRDKCMRDLGKMKDLGARAA